MTRPRAARSATLAPAPIVPVALVALVALVASSWPAVASADPPGAPLATPAAASDAPPVAAPPADVLEINRALGRGINLGAALEAPVEGDWGVTLEADDFDVVARAGFDAVRVPVRWSAHAGHEAPYAIDEAFFRRIDWVLDQAARTGLALVLNVHHYEELHADPDAERDRFLALWRQIATRYRDRPASVAFELLNEPTGAFDERPASWNALAADALAAVRETNPTRAVVIGPVGYNAIGRLDDLTLPDDPNLVLTVHYYDPFEFTHQGADWVEPVPPTGTAWDPDAVALGDAFADRSWNTRVAVRNGGLAVRFHAPFAALSLERLRPDAAPTRLELDVAGRTALDVACRAADGEFVDVARVATSGDEPERVRADLAGCGPGTAEIALRNALEDAPAFTLLDGRVCDAAGCDAVVATAGETIDAAIARAAAWADAAGVPLNVGEFGAYSAADLASRAAWTRRVQAAARTVGASSFFWDYAGEFGARDPVEGRWREPLLDALLPDRDAAPPR